jgi:hypothetical protein
MWHDFRYKHHVSASSSCRRPPVEFKAPSIGAWCSRAVVKEPCRRWIIMLFVFSGLFVVFLCYLGFSVVYSVVISVMVTQVVFGSSGFCNHPLPPSLVAQVLGIRVKAQ